MHIQLFKDAYNGYIYSFTKIFENIVFFLQFIFTSLSYATLLLLRNITTHSLSEN